MRNRILLAVILLLPLALFYFFWAYPGSIKMPRADSDTNTPAAVVARSLSAAPPQATAIIASNFAAMPQAVFFSLAAKAPTAPAGTPQPLEFTNYAPATVLDNIGHAIHDYGGMFGGNPVGLNSEITLQLEGQNLKHVNFINAEAGMRLNDRGELVDPWGTPYFFHQVSGHEMEIRSAGPDKVMWTADDLTTK